MFSAAVRRRARWVVYSILAMIAVSLIALVAWVRSGDLEERLRARLVAALGDALGRQVSVRRVSLRWLPPGVVIEGLEAEAPDLSVSRVEASISIRGLLRGRFTVTDLDVVEPVLRWDIDTQRFLADRDRRVVTPPESRRFGLRRARVTGGLLVLGSEKRSFAADLEGLEAQADNTGMTGGAGYRGPWSGTASFGRGRIVFGDLSVEGASASLAIEAAADLVTIRRLSVRAEGLTLHGEGEIRPGRPPGLSLSISGLIDPEGGGIRRPLPQFSAERIAASARISFGADGVAMEGTFDADAPLIDRDRTRTGAGPAEPWIARRASGTFSIARKVLEVSVAVEALAGGSAEGTYVGRPGAGDADPRRHRVTVEAIDLRLADLLTRIPLPGAPGVSPTALVSGRSAIEWDSGALDRVRGEADLTFEPGEGPLPLSGRARLAWAGRRLSIASSSLEVPASHVEIAGDIDMGRDPVALDLTADLLAQDTTPLAAFTEARLPSLFGRDGPQRRAALAPMDLIGGLSARIVVRGTTAAPQVESRFSSDGMTISVPPLAGGDAESRLTVGLISARGSLSWRPDRLDVGIEEALGDGLRVTGGVSLDPESRRLLALRMEADEIPAPLLGRLLRQDPTRLGMSGSARLVADLAPTAGGSLAGPLTFAADEVTLAGLTLTGVAASAVLAGDVLSIDRATFRLYGGEITGTGRFTLSPEPVTGGMDIVARGIDLEDVDAQVAGPSMAGRLDGGARLTIGEVSGLEGSLTGTSVAIAGVDLGTVTGTVDGPLDRPRIAIEEETGVLSATATLIFADPSEAAEATALPAIDLTARVRGLSLDKIRPLIPPDALRGLEGDADGVVTVRGPLLEPSDLEVRAEVSRVNLSAGSHPLSNDGPVRITIQDGFLTLAATRFVGEMTDLTVGGSMVLGGGYEVTARLSGTYDLGLLQILVPSIRASGPGTADLRVVERAGALTYTGSITLDGGRISDPALPLPLENVRGRGRFTEAGRLEVEEIGFLCGGGAAVGDGWARFEGARMPELHLDLEGRGIRAEILPELRAFFDADVTLDKEGEDYRLGGQVSVLRAIYSRPFGAEPSDILLRNRQFAPAAERAAGGGPQLLLDLDIVAERDVWVRNKDATIEASARLALTGTVGQPELSGRISAIEGGTYRFRDVTYTIVGGSLDFADVTRIDPVIDIEAHTRVQEYDVTLRVSGRFSRPLYELFSDPPLSQREIVWLLLTGRPLSDTESETTRNFAEGQVAAYLAAPVAGAVTDPIERALGITSVQIDPYFLNGTADPSARVTVTKRVTPALLFTYSSSLGQGGQEVYQVEYNPGRLWDLIGTRDLDGSVGADARFRRRWRGLRSASGDDRRTDAEGGGAGGVSRIRFGSIAIVADRLVEPVEKLIRILPFDEGDAYRRGDVFEGREALRLRYVRDGYPAARIEVIEDQPPDPDLSRKSVTYAIRSGPRYSLVVEGHARQRPLRKAVHEAWLEPVLLDDLADEARKAARRHLVDKGYYTARVDATLEAPGQEDRRVRLGIDRGSKVRVREVLIRGNDRIPEEDIRRQILVRGNVLLSAFGRGLLKEKVLADDVASVRGLYLANGYLSVKVPPPQVDVSPDGREADVTITIEEGPQWRVEGVALEGEAAGLAAGRLLETAGLEPRQVVTAEAVNGAANRLREDLDREGYWKARVSYRLEGDPDRTRVVFSITPGERGRVRDVVVEGNTRTRDRIVDREITVEEGGRLSRAALLETQRNIYRLGVFSSVQVDPEAVEGDPGLMDVRIRLREGSPLLTAWSAGYDTQDKVRGAFEVGNNNLFGTRRSAAIFLRGSAVDRRVQVTMRDPNLFGERIESLWSGFFERREYESYDMRRTGAIAQLARKTGRHTTLFASYRLEDIDLFNLKVSEDEVDQQTVRLGSVGFSVAHDTRDDIINPSRGGLASFDARIYNNAFGSEAEYTRLYASWSLFRDIGHRVVWASAVRAGTLSSRDIPLSERFFAGGDTTLRAFDTDTVGPEDPDTGKPTGGQGLFLLNQEIRFPIAGSFKGVVFYDAGNVYATLADYDITDLRHVGGLGLRVDTPVGPFRVEYGWKLDRKDGESAGQIYFSIGHAF